MSSIRHILRYRRMKRQVAKFTSEFAAPSYDEEAVVSARFNPQRHPKFRVDTYIEKRGDGLVVRKVPDTPEASGQIDAIEAGCRKLKGAYKRVEVLEGVREGDALVFPFIDGQPLLAWVDTAEDSLDDIVAAMNGALDVLFDFNGEPSGFVMTERFKACFPGCRPDPSEECYSVINLDSNVDNFLKAGDKIYCIDCEWTVDFPIPVRFVKFRTVLNYYLHHVDSLGGRIARDAFIARFGFSRKDIAMFCCMEDCFQLYVSGMGYPGSRF